MTGWKRLAGAFPLWCASRLKKAERKGHGRMARMGSMVPWREIRSGRFRGRDYSKILLIFSPRVFASNGLMI